MAPAVPVSLSVPALTGRDPSGYQCHPLHGPDRIYPESNCYSDIIIELVHACGHEPLAAFGFLARMDFEGDQWTFFKPPPEELELLFGIDVHEMQPYRPLPEQIAQQLAVGRTLIVELDAFYLPDTATTSYRREHVKSSVAFEAIDAATERLRYFHGGGLFELSGADYRGALRLGGAFTPEVLPPYTELVSFDAGSPLEGEDLRAAALTLLRRHLDRRPRGNPFERFGIQLAEVLPTLFEGDLTSYHAYAFATVRMAGAGFEIAAEHLRWLLGGEIEQTATGFKTIVDGCKALGFRLARRRPFDSESMIQALAFAWAESFEALEQALG